MGNILIPLDGGLVDIGAATSMGAETLKDCLNYERGIESGYTRVDGFSRWDGRFNWAALNQGLSFVSEVDANAFGFTVGDTYQVEYTDRTTNEYAYADVIVVEESTGVYDPDGGGVGIPTYRHYATGIFTTLPTNLSSAGDIGSISGALVVEIGLFPPYFRSSDALYSAYRNLVTSLPMSPVGKIAGAHFFRNRLYVIGDYAAISLTSVDSLGLKEGAQITNTSNSNAVIGTLVGYLDVTGDVAAGKATATIMVRDYTGEIPDPGDTLRCQSVTTNSGDFALFSAFVQSPRAGLFYADYNGAGGWNEVDAGRRMAYRTDSDCGTGGFTAYTRDGFSSDVVALDAMDSGAMTPETIRTGEAAGWVSSSDGVSEAMAADLENTGDDTAFKGLGSTAGLFSGPMTVRFGTTAADTIPAGAIITGLEVIVSRANSASSGAIYDQEVTLVGLSTPVQNKANLNTAWPNNSVYGADVTYGGPLDLWGTNGLSTELVRSADFGVRFSCRVLSSSPSVIAHVDKINVKIYYRLQTQQIYVVKYTAPSTYTDIDNFRVVHHTVQQGAFADQNAEGTIVISGLDTVYARTNDFEAGYQLRTAAGSGGDLVAKIAALDEPLTLPSSDVLAANETRWTFETCDPFAVDDASIAIMCSGVEQGYGFDGDFLLPIATGLKPEEELPRHAAYFQDQLFLGYRIGTVIASDIGNVLAFTGGAAGAAEIGVSDRVTGLLALKGTALAVFTERTIQAIYANGGVQEKKLITGDSGAIEYTVVNMGIPVFADFRGFGTISAVQEYGDFQRGKLTGKATRLMLSRLQYETRNQTVDKRPIVGFAIRNKSQYRVACRDGYVLTMTLAGDELNPQITKQRLFISGSNTDANAVQMLAVASGVTTEGRDVSFFTVNNQSTMHPYVYQIDAGRSFDSGAIVAYLVLNPAFGGTLSTVKRWDRVNVFGKAFGSASLSLSYASTFNTPSTSNARAFTLGSASNTVNLDPDPYDVTVDIGLEGKGISLRIDSSSSTELPHTLQMLDVVYSSTNEVKR